jgi:hypothetical protein
LGGQEDTWEQRSWGVKANEGSTEVAQFTHHPKDKGLSLPLLLVPGEIILQSTPRAKVTKLLPLLATFGESPGSCDLHNKVLYDRLQLLSVVSLIVCSFHLSLIFVRKAGAYLGTEVKGGGGGKANRGSTEVEQSPHHPKDKGLSPATAAGTRRKNISINIQC